MQVLFVAIGGGTGSGKSTLAEGLSESLGAPILRIDDYYLALRHLPLEERARSNYDAPESVDHALLLDHMTRLAQGETVEKPVYDFSRHTRSALTERVAPAGVVLIEGIFALHWAEVNARCAAQIFVETPADIRFARRLRRDVEERGRDEADVSARFWGHVAPMHELWVQPSKARADLVLSGLAPTPRNVAEARAGLFSLRSTLA